MSPSLQFLTATLNWVFVMPLYCILCVFTPTRKTGHFAWLRLPLVSGAFPASLVLLVWPRGDYWLCLGMHLTSLGYRECRVQAWRSSRRSRRSSRSSWKNFVYEQGVCSFDIFQLMFQWADNRLKTRHVWQGCNELWVAPLGQAGQSAAHVLIVVLQLRHFALECESWGSEVALVKFCSVTCRATTSCLTQSIITVEFWATFSRVLFMLSNFWVCWTKVLFNLPNSKLMFETSEGLTEVRGVPAPFFRSMSFNWKIWY